MAVVKHERKEGDEMKNVIVAIDEDGFEALYVSGDLKSCDGPTVYARDIAKAVGDELIQFSHVHFDRAIHQWPQKYEQLVV